MRHPARQHAQALELLPVQHAGRELAQLGDVADHRQRPDEAALVVEQRARRRLDHHARAVLAGELVLIAVVHAAASLREFTGEQRPLLGRDEVEQRAPEQLRGRVADDLRHALIDEGRALRGVDGPHALLGGRHDPAIALLAAAQRLEHPTGDDDLDEQTGDRLEPGEVLTAPPPVAAELQPGQDADQPPLVADRGDHAVGHAEPPGVVVERTSFGIPAPEHHDLAALQPLIERTQRAHHPPIDPRLRQPDLGPSHQQAVALVEESHGHRGDPEHRPDLGAHLLEGRVRVSVSGVQPGGDAGQGRGPRQPLTQALLEALALHVPAGPRREGRQDRLEVPQVRARRPVTDRDQADHLPALRPQRDARVALDAELDEHAVLGIQPAHARRELTDHAGRDVGAGRALQRVGLERARLPAEPERQRPHQGRLDWIDLGDLRDLHVEDPRQAARQGHVEVATGDPGGGLVQDPHGSRQRLVLVHIHADNIPGLDPAASPTVSADFAGDAH